MHPNGEMVEILEPVPLQPQNLVHRVVKVTSNSSRTRTGRLGLQIQDLAYHASLPKQITIKRWSMMLQGFFELGDHRQAEKTIGGNVLITADGSCLVAVVTFFQ